MIPELDQSSEISSSRLTVPESGLKIPSSAGVGYEILPDRRDHWRHEELTQNALISQQIDLHFPPEGEDKDNLVQSHT
jgi:hypothetical protein